MSEPALAQAWAFETSVRSLPMVPFIAPVGPIARAPWRAFVGEVPERGIAGGFYAAASTVGAVPVVLVRWPSRVAHVAECAA